jgi:hypothetical protein
MHSNARREEYLIREFRKDWIIRLILFARNKPAVVGQTFEMDSHKTADAAASEGKNLAEREGFEPPVRFPVHLISSQAPSTGLGHLSAVIQLVTRSSRRSQFLGKNVVALAAKLRPSISLIVNGQTVGPGPLRAWSNPCGLLHKRPTHDGAASQSKIRGIYSD